MKILFTYFALSAFLLVYSLSTSATYAQTTWNGSGADDFWFNSANWDTGLVPNSATDQVVVGSPSPTVVNGNVILESLTLTTDGVLTINSGLNLDLVGGVPTSVINAGSITTLNNTDFRILNLVDNSGSISINSATNFSDLELGVGGATLTGGGTVTLSGPFSGINDVSGVQTLTIADQTIEGQGDIGRNSINVDNQLGNLINANVNAEMLVLDASAFFTNAGTIRASGGGIIVLRDAGAGDFANTGGVIEALAGSEVQFNSNAHVVGAFSSQ